MDTNRREAEAKAAELEQRTRGIEEERDQKMRDWQSEKTGLESAKESLRQDVEKFSRTTPTLKI